MPIKTFTVPVKGKGKPDYTREIFAGKERAGIALKYNQQFRVFGSQWLSFEPEYPLFTPPIIYSIPAGGKRHMRDNDTGALMPITIPVGHSLTVVSVGYTVTQDIRIQVYIDGASPFGVAAILGVVGGGTSVYENKIREISTTWYDPTAEYPHTLDAITYNEGGADLYGGVALLCMEEIVGTEPFPTTKDCVCPHCNHKQTEPVTATRITCKGCGKGYMVTNFASLRQLGG